MAPTVLYARSGELQIAYSILGAGPVDVVWCAGAMSHLQGQLASPYFRQMWDRLGTYSRLILFDRRGSGMSDRPPGVATLEERIDDIRAVMDAAQSERAHIFGVSEGGQMASLFAATYPDRTRSLILWGTRPRWTRTADYPWGPTDEQAERALEESVANGWRPDLTSPFMRRWLGPRYRDDPVFLEAWAELGQLSMTPAARAAQERMNRIADVRGVLSSIRVPTIILAGADDPVMPPEIARDLVARIPGARHVQFEGHGHLLLGAWDEVNETIREWVTQAAAPVAADRFLATVLFVDLVGSTDRVVRIGDTAWRDLLGRYYAAVRRDLAVYGGVEVDTAGDGLLAHFDGPGRAIRCAMAIERTAAALGLEARAGLHTGEVERDGGAIRGIAVHLAARVGALAGAGEVLVSSTVRELVAGSGFSFADRGTHTLKGIPEPRQVLAVEAPA